MRPARCGWQKLPRADMESAPTDKLGNISKQKGSTMVNTQLENPACFRAHGRGRYPPCCGASGMMAAPACVCWKETASLPSVCRSAPPTAPWRSNTAINGPRGCAKFGDDVFAGGGTSLAQATLDALLEKRKLLVAVDEPTGRLLGSLCSRCPTARPSLTLAPRATPTAEIPPHHRAGAAAPALPRRHCAGRSPGRALAALRVTGADYAAAYMPASVGQCPFVLVCDRRGAGPAPCRPI